MNKLTLFLALGAAFLTFSGFPAGAQEGISIPVPAPELNQGDAGGEQVAILAAGCFWGVQGVFQHVEGVSSAVSGYAGGEAETASYMMVTSGRTGHAESVRVTVDPARISDGEILQIYFSVAHDPPQLNRQGPDIGEHYRSAIFPQSGGQADVALAYIDQLNAARVYDAASMTRIEPGQAWYPAEDYHQDYMTNNPTQPYIVY
ncbi:MAG: peptide-methionine (S)-S-oxide reductase MsrA, partial [Tropicimonas sp.]|uniref:peptide-methionine (S)-S-oxide reductase MsrA n=1 Tax=Tropicimonas sp. TaxID=2067044 RepID=UPI003A86ACA8